MYLYCVLYKVALCKLYSRGAEPLVLGVWSFLVAQRETSVLLPLTCDLEKDLSAVVVSTLTLYIYFTVFSRRSSCSCGHRANRGP